MGFGNPYGDLWNPDIVLHWVKKISEYGVKIFSLSDTVGLAKTDDIKSLFKHLIPTHPDLEFGAHFHTKPEEWKAKIDMAYDAGCRRFDGAMLGYGGCPLAQDDLVGNMPMEKLIDYTTEKNEYALLNLKALSDAREMFLHLIR